MCLNSLPLQAQLGLFFLFCLSSVSLDSPLSERRLYSFLSSCVFRLPWIRPQLPHPAPTGPVTRLAGVVSPTRPPKPHTRLHRAEFWFSLQNEFTPPPKGGGARYHLSWVRLVYSARPQAAHVGPTGPVFGLAGVVSLLGIQNRTQGHTGPSFVSPFFLSALWV